MKVPHLSLPRARITLDHLLGFLVQVTVFNVLLALIVVLALVNNGNTLLQTCVVLLMVVVPGVVLTRIFGITGPLFTQVGYFIAFGIAYLLYLGISVNVVLPHFGVPKPLSLFPFILFYGITTAFLFLCSLFLGKSYRIAWHPPKIRLPSVLMALVACAFPVLTFAGSIQLNNGGSNVFTFTALAGMAVYVIMVVCVRKYLDDWIFPWAIFLMSLALLFMYAARTPFLNGWDIQNEFRVFEHTLERGLWKPNSTGDIYNATLGITILPALLATVITAEPFLIFKYLYPFFFAFTGFAVYYLLRPRLPRIAAFLGAFFVVCQQSFASMPSLARQEIAFIMFLFILLMLFDRIHSRSVKSDTMLFLGGGMVLSHYSTSYVSLALFGITFLSGLLIWVYFRLFPKVRIPDARFMLNGFVIVILTASTVLWYGYYTQATGNLNDLFWSVYGNISKIHSEEAKASQSWITISGSIRSGDGQDLRRYIDSVMDRYRFDPNNLSFYPLDVAEQYPVSITKPKVIPGDPVIEPLAFQSIIAVRQIIKVMMVLGMVLATFLFLFRRKLAVDAEWLVMAYVYMLLIVLIVIVPDFSRHYNIERLYQQGLMILVFFPIFFVLTIWRKRWPTLKYLLVSMVIIVYFFSHHGMISQVFGGQPTINLNNFGEDFDQYYITESELKSAEWFYIFRDPRKTVFADKHAALRLASQGRVSNIISDILPVVFFKDAYVYATAKNHRSGTVQGTFNGVNFTYSYPTDFLDDNKNMIYSNGPSVLYK